MFSDWKFTVFISCFSKIDKAFCIELCMIGQNHGIRITNSDVLGLHDRAWHTLVIISKLHLIIFKYIFTALFLSIKINVIITCKCRATLDSLHCIMVSFDLTSCPSSAVKHSDKLGIFFCVDAIYLEGNEISLNLTWKFFPCLVNLKLRLFYANWFG